MQKIGYEQSRVISTERIPKRWWQQLEKKNYERADPIIRKVSVCRYDLLKSTYQSPIERQDITTRQLPGNLNKPNAFDSHPKESNFKCIENEIFLILIDFSSVFLEEIKPIRSLC
jgi:hypothetical protein